MRYGLYLKELTLAPGNLIRQLSYFYSTYEEEDESHPSKNKKVLILGGGPNRIGQGIEFDCCVHAVFASKALGFELLWLIVTQRQFRRITILLIGFILNL